MNEDKEIRMFLIVDGDGNLLNILKGSYRDRKIIFVSDVEEALKKIRFFSFRIDLIFLDEDIKAGLKLLNKIKDQRPKIPVILIGTECPDNNPTDGFIKKPIIKGAEVIKEIKRVMDLFEKSKP